MSIDPVSDRAVYKQIADHLRNSIRSGDYQPGDALPSENDLISQYRVSRVTARKALAILVGEGRITVEHGRGAFVRNPPPVMRLGIERFSRRRRAAGDAAFASETKSQGMVPVQLMREVAEIDPPSRIANLLELKAGERVVVRRRLMLADDTPMQLADSYFPASWARGTQLVEQSTGPGGTYARIEESGRRIARFREELVARMPEPEEERSLLLPPGIPVVHLVRIAFDETGAPVEVFDSIAAGDKHIFIYEFEAPD